MARKEVLAFLCLILQGQKKAVVAPEKDTEDDYAMLGVWAMLALLHVNANYQLGSRKLAHAWSVQIWPLNFALE